MDSPRLFRQNAQYFGEDIQELRLFEETPTASEHKCVPERIPETAPVDIDYEDTVVDDESDQGSHDLEIDYDDIVVDDESRQDLRDFEIPSTINIIGNDVHNPELSESDVEIISAIPGTLGPLRATVFESPDKCTTRSLFTWFNPVVIIKQIRILLFKE